jgi:hypothetical protein
VRSRFKKNEKGETVKEKRAEMLEEETKRREKRRKGAGKKTEVVVMG